MADRRTLHIVFTSSAAVDLRRALQDVGKDEEVIASVENWAAGPLIDMSRRRKFFCDDLGIGDEYGDENKAFYRQTLSTEARRIVWFSKWSTLEYCGFLEWLRRNGDEAFELVDLSDSYITNTDGQKLPVGCTSLVQASEYISEAFWDKARFPTLNELEAWQNLWAKLRQEDARIRVVTPDGLVSAHIEYFDVELLSYVGKTWTRASHVVGNVMGKMIFESFRKGGVYQTGDMLLFSRIWALVDMGVIEAKGTSRNPYRFWVRLRQAGKSISWVQSIKAFLKKLECVS